jgi:microcystin-dependent protein
MPDPGASANTWGATLNATTQKIDQQVYDDQQAAVQSGAPVGSGALWFAATPPANWLICDGSSLDTTTYAALFAVIGTKYGSADASHFNLPNLLEAFPLGAGATHALAATGGEATHLLTTAEIPAHTHPASQAAHTHTATQAAHTHPDPGHTHGITDPGHAHAGIYVPGGAGGWFYAFAGQVLQAGLTAAAAVGISINGAVTNLQAAQPAIAVVAQTPAVTVSANTGGGAAHNNLPPFLAINFIIKYQ